MQYYYSRVYMLLAVFRKAKARYACMDSLLLAEAWLCMITLYTGFLFEISLDLIFFPYIQLTLVISTSLISNNRLSRTENLVPAYT